MAKDLQLKQLESRLTAVKNSAKPLTLVAYRSATPKYANEDDMISGEGSRRFGARWNPVGIATIYASLTPETAMAETLAHVRYYCLPVHSVMPRMFVAIEFSLKKVLDLTSGSIRRRVGVSEKRMLETDWRKELDKGNDPITQVIGNACFNSGLEALLVPSAALDGGTNIVAFPANFGKKL